MFESPDRIYNGPTTSKERNGALEHPSKPHLLHGIFHKATDGIPSGLRRTEEVS